MGMGTACNARIMDIVCNVPTCRKPLTGALWVTSCSHSFCEEHASTLTRPSQHKSSKCPACDTVLGKRFDVIRQNSNPPDDFRAMLLVGLRPDIALDIAMRAISFWNYQMEQELRFQSNSARHLKETVEQIKDNHSSIMRQLISTKKTAHNNERLVGDLKTTIKHLKEQIAFKEHQLQKLQTLINSTTDETHLWQTDFPNTSADKDFPPTHVNAGDPLEQYIHCGLRKKNYKSEFVFEPSCIAPKKKVNE